jgi:broad specificity phosphatase PhoE
MINQNTKKFIIFTRHGERTDHVGLTPKLYKFDPELTPRGVEQAKEIGAKLRQKLVIEMGIESDSIAIVSSPFGRTLQTSKEIVKELKPNISEYTSSTTTREDKIYVNNLLSELIDATFCGEMPKDFLSIHTDSLILKEELKHVNLHFMNELDKLPTLENIKECQYRMNSLVKEMVDCFFLKENKDAIVLVSHGLPIDLLNLNVQYPGPFGMQNICYCATFIHSYDSEKKEFEFVEKITPDEFNK